MSLDMLEGTWTWVWKEPPVPVRFCRGLIVRAANGNGWTAPEGFDFRANYRAWRASFAGPLIAWTYLYNTSDPQLAAEMLAQVDAVAYVIDWEDAAGPAPSGAQFQRCVDRLRSLRPDRPVGFSSYPTRAQAQAHGVDWDAGLAVCDFVAPQMYYGYQIADYAQVLADAKGRYVQLDVEPRASTHWGDHVQEHLSTGQGVSFWRLGILDGAVRQQISFFEEAHDVTKADVIAAIRETLNLSGDLGVPKGQISNDKVTQILMDRSGAAHNDLAGLAQQVATLQESTDALAARVEELAARGGPAPAGGVVSGTFTGTVTPGGAQ